MTIIYTKKIYFSGGSSAELQEVFSRRAGVVSATCGRICGAKDEREGVELSYDPKKADISTLLDLLFAVVDPYRPDGQGSCTGEKYRAGVFYVSYEDEPQIELHLNFIAARGKSPAVTGAALTLNDPDTQRREQKKLCATAERLKTFTPAPDEDQNLLRKQPDRKTYINLDRLKELKIID